MSPHAGVTVGLQLESDRELVREIRMLHLHATHTRLSTEQPLHMMAELVGDHVRLREITGRAKAAIQLVEEAQVEIDALVHWTVEGSHRRLRSAASGLRAVAEEHELRGLIALAQAVERAGPRILDVIN